MAKASICYELSLTPTYVSDWTFLDAMRELIQNGIDQEVLDKNNKFTLEYDRDRQVIRLINTRSKLNINTLLLGKSSKSNNSDTIGQFGEGYKIASLVLNRLGKTFTIYNNNAKQMWVSKFKNSEKWREKILAYYISELEPTNEGLVIEVGNVNEDDYYDIADIWLGFYKYDNIDKVQTSYGDILTDEEYAGQVFVSGLAINYNGDLHYGYNFKPKYINLERDRKTCDSWNAKIITSKMIAEGLINGDIKPETIQEMVTKDCDDVYQMDIIGENGGVKSILIAEFDRNNPQPYSIPVSSQQDFKRVKMMGGNPVIVQHRVASILRNETARRIEELANAPMSVGMSTYSKLMRWISIYQGSLDKSAIEEFKKIASELE